MNIIFLVLTWRRRRKLLIPAFSPKKIDRLMEIFSKNSEKLVKKLAKVHGKEKFCLWPYLSEYALDSVCGVYK